MEVPNESPRTPEGTRTVAEQVVGISFVPAAWVLTRWLFYEGYFDALGVPPELGLVPPVSVSSLLTAGVFGYMFVEGYWQIVKHPWFVRKQEESVFRFLLSLSVTILLGALGLAAVLALLVGYEKIWLSIAVAGSATLIAWMWVAPLRRRGEGSYRERAERYLSDIHARDMATLEAARSARRARPPGTGNDLLDFVVRVIGRRGGTAILVALALAFVGYQAGRWAAKSKTQWVIVNHPSLPSTVEGAWVLLSTAEGKLWVASAADRVLLPEVLVIDPAGAKLTSASLEPLRRASRLQPLGQTTSSTSEQTPPAPLPVPGIAGEPVRAEPDSATEPPARAEPDSSTDRPASCSAEQQEPESSR